MGKRFEIFKHVLKSVDIISECIDGELISSGYEVPTDWIPVLPVDEDESDVPVCPYCGEDIYYKDGTYFCGSCEIELTRQEIEDACGFAIRPKR